MAGGQRFPAPAFDDFDPGCRRLFRIYGAACGQVPVSLLPLAGNFNEIVELLLEFRIGSI
jgi:hypothetical protein